MYTAKIINKEEIDNIFSITVEFTNGTKTIIEKVKPQDEDGFKHWVRSRLQSLETSEALQTADNLGQVIDLSTPESIDTRTQAEKDRDTWLIKYNKWVRIKTTLIDTGVVSANNPQAVAFLEDVKTGFLTSYINFI